MLNSDLWFHLAAGRAIAESGHIPRTDSWSFTAAGRPWHNHEWLSGLVFWKWTEHLGVESLVIWQWAVLAATSVLLFDLLRRWCGPVLAFVSLLGTLWVASPFFDIRPHLWSLLGFALLLRLTLVPSGAALALPAVFALWANLHGGVVFGLMALAVIVAAQSLSSETAKPVRRRGQGLFVACLLATLLNPFGWRVLTYPLSLAAAGRTPTRQYLVEWTSPLLPGGIVSPAFLPVLAVTVILGLTLGTNREQRRQPESVACLLLVMLTAAMALTSRRFIPLFGIAAALLQARAVPLLFPRWRGARAVGGAGNVWVPLLALALAVGRLYGEVVAPRSFVALTRQERMPEDSLRFAQENGLKGNLFSYMLWGGYVEWRTPGIFRVFLDPRSETVYDAATQQRYFEISELRPGWQQTLERSGADFVLWPFAPESRRALVEALLAGGRWRMLHAGSQGILLARVDLQLPPVRDPSPLTAWDWWGLARRELGAGNMLEAERLLSRAVNQRPELPGVCTELVVVQRKLGAFERAAHTATSCRQRFGRAVDGLI